MKRKPPFIPDRGDVVWLDFNPQAGHEQGGRRPALVLSPIEYNEKVGLLACCPITSQAKGYPFEVAIPSGRPVAGVVLSDQVKNLDWKVRRADLLCRLPEEIVASVFGRICSLLDPEQE